MLAISVKLLRKSVKSPISVPAKLKVTDLESFIFFVDVNPLLLHQVQPLYTLSPLVSIKCTHQMALIHRELKMPSPKQFIYCSLLNTENNNSMCQINKST